MVLIFNAPRREEFLRVSFPVDLWARIDAVGAYAGAVGINRAARLHMGQLWTAIGKDTNVANVQLRAHAACVARVREKALFLGLTWKGGVFQRSLSHSWGAAFLYAAEANQRKKGLEG